MEVLHLIAFLLQFLRRIEGDICLAVGKQLVHILLIDTAPLALTIGTILAAEVHALVKLDAQPVERLNDIFLGTRHETVGVCVLNAEHQIAAMLACKQIIIQGGAYATDM